MPDIDLELDNLFAKHCILSDGLRRMYIVNTSERRLDMDRSTPIKLCFLEKVDEEKFFNPGLINKYIESRSWVQMIENLVKYLQEKHPKPLETLYRFKVDWSEASIFDGSKSLANMRKISDDLYVNVGHTANHLLWLIDDILLLYGYTYALLLVNRPPLSEPQEIVTFVKDKMKKGFIDYLKAEGFDENKTEKVLKGIDIFNYMLVKERGSYNDIYMIDNYNTFTAVKAKVISIIPKYTNWNDAQVNTAKKYLNLYFEYFKNLEKSSKNKSIDFYIPII